MNKKIYIERLFPDVAENNLFHKLKIDHESIMYITIPYYADIITNIIMIQLEKHCMKSTDVIITDATAGVGGNTISFAKNFKEVVAIEIDKTRYNYLSNNIFVYKLENVILLRDDLINVIPLIDQQDVIFIDPPWGGKAYKKANLLRLTIGDEEIETYCNMFFDKTKTKCPPKFIILKLPSNYDVEYLKLQLENTADIIVHELNKMIIVVLIKKYEIKL